MFIKLIISYEVKCVLFVIIPISAFLVVEVKKIRVDFMK